MIKSNLSVAPLTRTVITVRNPQQYNIFLNSRSGPWTMYRGHADSFQDLSSRANRLSLSLVPTILPGHARWGHLKRVGEECCCHALQGLVARMFHTLWIPARHGSWMECRMGVRRVRGEASNLRAHKNSGSRGHKVLYRIYRQKQAINNSSTWWFEIFEGKLHYTNKFC